STFAGRVATSLLDAVGLSQLATANLENYEALARKIAGDPALLASIRDKLARNRSSCPLFDTARFARHLEAAYERMYDIWQRGEGPQSFSVEAISARQP